MNRRSILKTLLGLAAAPFLPRPNPERFYKPEWFELPIAPSPYDHEFAALAAELKRVYHPAALEAPVLARSSYLEHLQACEGPPSLNAVIVDLKDPYEEEEHE